MNSPRHATSVSVPAPFKPNRAVVLILSLALLARVLVVWMAVHQHGAKWLFTRGLEVGFVATSLLTGHGFASPFGGETGPTALIAPGYPLLVAGVFKLFGISSVSSALIMMVLQIFANLATIFLMMRLAGALANERAGVIAGLFWACWPPFLWMPTIFWETSLSAVILLSTLEFALSISRRPSLRRWILFGSLCGIAALINMAFLITFAAVFVWLIAQTFRKETRNALSAALVFLILFSVWPIRNAEAFHAFIPLRTTVGLELWMGNHDGSSGFLEESMFPIYNRAELNEYLRLGELGYDRDKSSQAHEWINAHPNAFIKLSLLRALRFWDGAGSRNGSPLFVVGALLTTALGLWGLYLLWRRREHAMAVLFALPLALFPLPYYITHAEFRYRLVLDPLLTVLSACAVTGFRQRQEQAHSHVSVDLNTAGL